MHVRSSRASRSRWLLTAILFPSLLAIAFVPVTSAQKAPTTGRKIEKFVKPEYPPMLKAMHIEGMVRLNAVVLPNGSVAAVEVKGGNPILVENSVKAVKAWKYAPGPAQTDEEIVLDFGK